MHTGPFTWYGKSLWRDLREIPDMTPYRQKCISSAAPLHDIWSLLRAYFRGRDLRPKVSCQPEDQ